MARPGLFGRLGGPARVSVVSAPAGSGKTVLLRSWMAGAGLAGRAAWVPVGPGERDPQRFLLSVAGALGQTGPGAGLVRAVTGAPDLDGWALAEGLLSDLAPLAGPVWLVVDDVHELGKDALRQLELFLMRAPAGLRLVLAARHDVRLGLHRLRLEGGLAELRAGDLRFTLAEAGELFAAAGVELDEAAVAVLWERTEGWVAGLRLAALALAGGADPGRFAAEFSGSERTVAEYLLAEVLDRQSERVRRLLLRTSILERVNGELGGLLTGDEGGERVLQDLEAAGAFVVSLDAARSWFRYHQLFAGLLRLELRRTAPGEVTGLHAAAGQFLAGLGEQDRDRGEIRVAAAALRLAQGDPQGALAALAPVDENPVAEDYWGLWRGRAGVLEALARDALGDSDAADAALERALDLSERSGDLTPFLSYPAAGLLERHARHRTAHAALVAEIRGLLAPGGYGGTGSPSMSRGGLGGIVRPGLTQPLLEPLSGSEARVLRYLPTNLTGPEIARELSVFTNTVKTHIRHLYAKFGTHHRAEAVDLARALGLLAPARTSPARR